MPLLRKHSQTHLSPSVSEPSSMEVTTFCAIIGCLCHSSFAAPLRVLPNRSQFFQYESLSLSCGWRVMKNTSKQVNKVCSPSKNGTSNESQCSFDALYPTDTGVYWCESEAGERSDAVNITVTSDSVILEGPALPVTEGDNVTLTCRVKTTSSSNSSSSLKADFYKDGLLLRRSSTADVTLRGVSKADEGLYNCSVSGAGQSPAVWLTIRAPVKTPGHPDPPDYAHIPLPVVVVGPSLIVLISLTLLCIWRSLRGRADPDIPYVDITIVQEVAPQRIADTEPTFYSTVKPANT